MKKNKIQLHLKGSSNVRGFEEFVMRKDLVSETGGMTSFVLYTQWSAFVATMHVGYVKHFLVTN